MVRRSNKKNKKKNTSTGEGTITTTAATTTVTTIAPSTDRPLFHISRCTSTDISSINDNDWLVFEILNRLPVKSLARFKSLCKRWCYIIERDQQFIDLHLTRSKTRLPSRLLIVVPLPRTQKQIETLESLQGSCYFDIWPFKEFHLTADLFFQEQELKLVVDTVREINSVSYNVISKPVNGLVCLIDSDIHHVVRIRNITTGEMSPGFQSSSIVVGEEYISSPNFYALGFDPATNQHKLVCVLTVSSRRLYSKSSIVCGVLAIGRHNNGWRRINAIPPYELNDDYVHVNGVIYWSNCSLDRLGLIPRRPVCLVAFDLGSEKFTTITIPEFILDRHPRDLGYYLIFEDIVQLFEVDGYLTMVVKLNNRTFNMYIYEDDYYMEEDEEFNGTSTTSSLKNGRWTEVSCITLPSYMMNNHNDVKFHTFIGSDDKILVTSSPLSMEKEGLSIYCYNWKKGTWTKVDVSGIPSSVPQLSHHCFSTTFSESLLPLNNHSAL